MFQADHWIEQIRSTEHGTSRLEIMQNAIREADDQAADYWRIYFRYEYVKESIFHDDNFKAIIMFPELLAVFDEHPELEDDTYEDVMQAFKWVLENMPDYYQVSLAEIERYYAEYEARCKKYGYSLRVFHMKRSKLFLPIDRDAARREYEAFHGCKRDVNSDCEACEIHHDMRMALEFGEEEEALRIAAPVLDGRKRCAEVPHVTYGALLRFYLYRGDLSEAAYYGRLCARYTDNEPEFLEETGNLLELYSTSDIRTGWKTLKCNISSFVKCRNPIMRLTFARGAYRLLQHISEETEYADSVLLQPLPVKRTKEGYSVKELLEYFYGIAQQQSELLDKRNGTSYYMDQLAQKLAQAETDAALDDSGKHPAHGLIRRAPSSLAAVPKPEQELMLAQVSERLDSLSDKMEILSNNVSDNVCHLTFRFEERLYDAYLFVLEVSEQFSGRPYYQISEEDCEAILNAPKHLLLQMEFGDDPQLSYHLAMKLLTTAVPELIGVIDITTEKIYPANWALFAGSCRNAVALRDLFVLSITGSQDVDEIWMTTMGLCTAGMRELEIIGATKENYGYYADILFHAACNCLSDRMLTDAGEELMELTINDEECLLTWQTVETAIIGKEELRAAKAERGIPSAVLSVLTEEGECVHLTDYAPMREMPEVGYSGDRGEYIRRIYLAKETLPQFMNAYRSLSMSVPLEVAAARVEFTLSPEMRQEYGYSKELLWAEIEEMNGDTIRARIAETSELLPECSEGDEVIITEENITGWLIRPQGAEEQFTEEDAYEFM